MGKEYCLMNFTRLEGQLKVTKENGDDLEGNGLFVHYFQLHFGGKYFLRRKNFDIMNLI